VEKIETDFLMIGHGPIVSKLIDRILNKKQRIVCVSDYFDPTTFPNLSSKLMFFSKNEISKIKVSCNNVIFSWRDDGVFLDDRSGMLDWLLTKLDVKNKSFLLSSSSVYKDSQLPLNEDFHNLDSNAINLGKYRLELRLKEIMEKKGNHQVNLRISNLYGSGIKYGFIGKLIDALETNAKVSIYNYLDFTRDYIDINDLCFALLLLCETEFTENELNVATGKGYKISRVIQLFKTNGFPDELLQNSVYEGEIKNCSILDPTSLKKIINWDPLDLDTMIPKLLTERPAI
jgi:UDP-glucose 4-epimerase